MTAVDLPPRLGESPSAPAPPMGGWSHFDLYLLAALLRLREQLVGFDRLAAADGPFAFLGDYANRFPAWAADRSPERAWAAWLDAVGALERGAPGHLPIRALRDAIGLGDVPIVLLVTAGLVDEDHRFGALFAALEPGRRRPTAGLLGGWGQTPDERRETRVAVARLLDLGILEAPPADPGSADASIRPAEAIWAALRGEPRPRPVSWARYRSPSAALPVDQLILDPEEGRRVRSIPALIRDGHCRCVLVRGPRWGGRATSLAAVARELGFGRLEVDEADLDPSRWRILGPLATVLGAMPVIRVEPAVGETSEVPEVDGWTGPVGIVTPRHGGIQGPAVEHAVTVELTIPARAERRRHWLRSLDDADSPEVDEIAARFRLTGGSIQRAARLARSIAALDERVSVRSDDVLVASRLLRTRALETLAPFVPTSGRWSDLIVDDDTRLELSLLEDRCRAREELVGTLPSAIAVRTAGVRAMFTGPSGTGKTLAAGLLASEIGMDLHLVQLSTIVDKFLGETEKNLTTVFARAAELDAVLLIDEGDALLTSRTDVRTSNDRYANLQTNHLLQLLDAHDGIVIVTTNAGDRIDGAFLRRMDATVEFRAPDAGQRYALWLLHLPLDHRVSDGLLAEIATRCVLTGGQIRNAVLHAWLLGRGAGEPGGRIADGDLETAVRREYRKIGATCPLRPGAGQ